MTAVSYSAIPELKKEDISFVDVVKAPLADPVNLEAEKGTLKACISAMKDTVFNYFESLKFKTHINNLKQFEKLDQNFAENLSAWSKVDKGLPSVELKAVYGQVGQSLVAVAQTWRNNYDELNRRLVNATGLNLKEITEAKHDSLTNAQKAEINKISKEFCGALKTHEEALKTTIEKVAVAVDELRNSVGSLSESLQKDVTKLEESSRKLREEAVYRGYIPALPQDGMNLFVEARKEIVIEIAKSETLQKNGSDKFVEEIKAASKKLEVAAALSANLNKEIEKTHSVLQSNQKQRAYLANEFDKAPEGAKAVTVSKELVSSVSAWFDKQECKAIHGADLPAYLTPPGAESLRMTLDKVKTQEDLDKASTKVESFSQESKFNRATVNDIGKAMLSFNELLKVAEGEKVDHSLKKLVVKTEKAYEKQLIKILEESVDAATARAEVLKVLDSADKTVQALKNYDEKFLKEFSSFVMDKTKDPITREAGKALQEKLQKEFNSVFGGALEDSVKFNKEFVAVLDKATLALENTKKLDDHLRKKVPVELTTGPIDREAASLIKEAQDIYVSKINSLASECEDYDTLNNKLGETLVLYAKWYDVFIDLARSGKPNMNLAEYSDMMDGLRADLGTISIRRRYSFR